MKVIRVFSFAFLLLAAGITNAQVGIGTPTPNVSAQLDVSSTTKGLLPPRMTAAQRDDIPKPVAGLVIWCNNCGLSGEIQVYNGTTWTNMVGGSSQVWMLQNLDVSTCRNGDTIPQVTDSTQWANLTTGAWCYYNNDPSNRAAYGKLYNGFAVFDPRGLAPAGWHIPSDEEWVILTTFWGGESVAGNKMKETGMTHWASLNTDATNTSGFTGLPGGLRYANGPFPRIGDGGYWWSSTESYSEGIWAWYRSLFYYEPNVTRFYIDNKVGFSLRCIKD